MDTLAAATYYVVALGMHVVAMHAWRVHLRGWNSPKKLQYEISRRAREVLEALDGAHLGLGEASCGYLLHRDSAFPTTPRNETVEAVRVLGLVMRLPTGPVPAAAEGAK